MLNTLLPAALYTHHMPSGDGTGPGGRIIGTLAAASTNPDGSPRLHEAIDDDFNGHIDAGAGTSGALRNGTFYKDTGATMVSDITKEGGVMNMVSAATDNHEVWFKGGAGCKLDVNPAVDPQLQFDTPAFFEARASFPVGAGDVFVGLMTAGAAAADILTDAGALPDDNYFGFLISSGVINFVSRKAGEAAVTLASSLATVTGTHQLGFIYSRKPITSSLEKLNIFVDNVQLGNVLGSVLTDTAVPKGEILAPVIGFKNTAGASLTLGADWIYAYSLMQ